MHYFVVSSNGTAKLDVDIPLPDPVMMHDMAITEDYAIFLDFPLIFNPQACTFSLLRCSDCPSSWV
jgi:carotenoid cleavage dioxygenase